jgi:uncharacterized protein (AIM24 family)
MTMDVIDFKIFGSEMQYVEIELDPGEAAIGEAGSMMYMESGVAMDTVFGDGSAQVSHFSPRSTPTTPMSNASLPLERPTPARFCPWI